MRCFKEAPRLFQPLGNFGEDVLEPFTTALGTVCQLGFRDTKNIPAIGAEVIDAAARPLVGRHDDVGRVGI